MKKEYSKMAGNIYTEKLRHQAQKQWNYEIGKVNKNYFKVEL